MQIFQKIKALRKHAISFSICAIFIALFVTPTSPAYAQYVCPNGAGPGEKQIGINQGSEFVRFSGVVNPLWLTPANAISSTRVADARLEYRGNGYVDEAQTMGWLSRFFLSVLPF